MKTLRKPAAFLLLRRACAAAAFGIAALSARADYSATILADHPVAYYRMEEASGSGTVADSSGNANDGLVNYITQGDNVTVYPQLGVPGIDSNAVLFATSTGSGQGDIDIPSDPTINPTLADGQTGAAFTVELWIQATTDSTHNFEVPLDDSSDYNQPAPYNNSAGWNFYQTQGPGSTWSYSMRPNPGYVGGGPAVVIGQWTLLDLSYDGTNATFYVNGVQARKDAIPQFLAQNGTADLIAGQGPATGFAPFDGYEDEIAIYNYPLTAGQVTTHYTVGTNEIRAVPTAPSFSLEPTSTNEFAGVPITFSAQALGTAPISYQWVRQGTGPIQGQTNNTYTITPSYPGDNGAVFFVTATNIAGSTNSDPFTLTVSTNVTINNDPFSITRRVGSHAAFRVAAVGAVPLTYQWHSIVNSVDQPINGATSDTLWLSNIEANQDGNSYYAVVTDPFTSANSDPATLSVIPAEVNPAPVTPYSSIVLGDKPVAYWRLDEPNGSTNAVDSAGSFDGSYQDPSGTFVFGYPSGIPGDVDGALHVENTAIVTIPYALELNPVTGPWTYEFWIQPSMLDSTNFHTPISAEGNQNSGNNLSGWNLYQHVASAWTWNLFNGGGGGSFSSEFFDYPIVVGTWYHMVMTDDTTNLNWYSNDRLVLSMTTASVSFLPNGINGDPSVAGAGPTTIAVRSDGAFGAWDGGVEDVAVYNYVLSPQQVKNHYLNSALSVAPAGSNVVLTWTAGTLQSSSTVSGGYADVPGAVSPYTVAASGTQFYRVQFP